MTNDKNIREIYSILDELNENFPGSDSLVSKLKTRVNYFVETNNKQFGSETTNINSFLYAILNSIPDPIFIKDENHKWVFLNDSACELFGFKREELIGKSDYDIFLHEEADIYWHVDKQVIKYGKEIRNVEFQTHPISGERRTIDTKKILYIDELGARYIVGVIRDITEQKIAEEKMIQAVASKEKIFSIIAHDLKQPFNTLLGFSRLLNKNYKKYNDDKRLEFIKNLETIANNTFDLILNILDWTASQTGNISFDPQTINLKLILENTYLLFKETAAKKKIKIITEICSSNSCVFADRNMIETILRNLISNAIKFTPLNGNIQITVKDNNKEFVEICICDTGLGIKQKRIKSLFSNQSVIPEKGTAGENGIGLGLLVVKEFIDIHKTEIWYEPNIPNGSKFCFLLPKSIEQ